MWDDWKKAWQEAVNNFERELHGPEDGQGSTGGRASAMRRDLAAARNALGRLQDDLAQARRDLSSEEEAEQTALRRADAEKLRSVST